MRIERWLVCWVFTLARAAWADKAPENEKPSGLFSPRMDYEQWKPLGRGDPLKNDPTYDYVPPQLDRVHYWMDPRKPESDNQKTEILLLGVSSKKPSTGTSAAVADSRKDSYDSFLKFVDGPKFSQRRPGFQYYQPKNKNRGGEQRMPYTMLMPPPMATKTPNPVTLQQLTTNSVKSTLAASSTTSTTPTSAEITVQTANLIYHSSSVANDWKTTQLPLDLTSKPAFQKHLQPPESYIQIQFAPTQDTLTNKPLVASNSDHNINYVTPPPLAEEVMHKGEVTDDNLDISNTYVKIGKPEAQMHSTGMDNMPNSMLIFSHVKHPMTAPTTVETTTATSSTAVSSTSTTTSLTTDPLFKHYKQPAELQRGPLYLIIQGHSKVKTYGASKQFHGIRVQETNEIPDDNREEIHVKHLHARQNNSEEGRREARAGNLQTLKHVIETRLGALDFKDLKEAELHFGYEVRDDVTTEKYHKGIVEEARKLHFDENKEA